MVKEKYFTKIHYYGEMDGTTYNTLDSLAIFYEGTEGASNLRSGLALFVFEELEKAEKFKDISERLLGERADAEIIKPQ